MHYWHELLTTWFHWMEQTGYWGVFCLMALESTIVPIPSEIIIPPAAFWAAQGKLNIWGVVAAGGGGSLLGSLISYYVAQFVGAPIVKKYGRYFLLPEDKILMAETWIKKHGAVGVFTARLLPVFRHLISIPAGLFRMPVVLFSVVTTVGATFWCLVLALWGKSVIGAHPELMDSPEALIAAMKSESKHLILGVVILAVLYVFVIKLKRTKSSSNAV